MYLISNSYDQIKKYLKQIISIISETVRKKKISF